MSNREAHAAHPAADAAETLVVACAHCGQKNRIQKGRRGDQAVCGRCKQPVFANRPITATDANWQTEVAGAGVPVLVDFWAPWCGPCRAVAPMIDAIAQERAGRLKVVKLNVDENPKTAARYGIQAIPTMMIFRGTDIIDQIRGALPKPTLDARLDQLKL
jgi:thioredoxin 2